MINRIKQDNIYLGLILGLILPGLVLLVLAGINEIVLLTGNEKGLLNPEDRGLISIFSNLFILRYYMVNLKFDKTGRGILLMTFVLAIIVFYFLFKH